MKRIVFLALLVLSILFISGCNNNKQMRYICPDDTIVSEDSKCFGTSHIYCGNYNCDYDENCESCPSDCGECLRNTKNEGCVLSCVKGSIIKSGDRKNLDLTIQNKGNEANTYTATINCESVGITGHATEIGVDAGQTNKMSVSIAGQNTQKNTQCGVCEVLVRGGYGQTEGNCEFKMCVEYQDNLACEPTTHKCINDKDMKICSADGTSYEVRECDECRVLENGNAVCGIYY